MLMDGFEASNSRVDSRQPLFLLAVSRPFPNSLSFTDFFCRGCYLFFCFLGWAMYLRWMSENRGWAAEGCNSEPTDWFKFASLLCFCAVLKLQGGAESGRFEVNASFMSPQLPTLEFFEARYLHSSPLCRLFQRENLFMNL
ncbi:hypothetical protein TWF730_006486 [Orbilia blumenaviensis]|uniref:Uncharacterized protein n=1 Tax=Orbilia blumenaviensis TaxID=1796055 RepID=A0AAV9VKP3_9PEZI